MQLITFETAVLAKEKGFDWPSDYHYAIIKNMYSEKAKLRKLGFYKHNSRKGQIAAPDQSELQKWLRDKHNIDIEPYLVISTINDIEIEQEIDSKEYFYKIIVKGVNKWTYGSDLLNSYESALEAGLQEGLKLI